MVSLQIAKGLSCERGLERAEAGSIDRKEKSKFQLITSNNPLIELISNVI